MGSLVLDELLNSKEALSAYVKESLDEKAQDLHYEEIADKTEGDSGSDIRLVCKVRHS